MSSRVYVGGLSYRARERDVERHFRKFGRVREISLKNGYAFVDFDDYRDAEDAVYEANGKDFMGDR